MLVIPNQYLLSTHHSCWSKCSRVICSCHPYYPVCLTIKYHYTLLHSNLWPIIVSMLTHRFYFFCTYYSCTTKTSLLYQSVLNYDRFMYSPQRLLLAVQLWGMFLLLTYHICTYKSCRHDKLQVNELQRLSLTVQLWDMINYRLLSPAPLCVLPLLPHHVHHHPCHL